MTAESKCEECGVSLPSNAPQGLCPRCLAGVGIALAPAEFPAASARHPAAANESSDRGSNRRIGDYELLDEIARGGMGVVYRARQISKNRIVAVKTLPFGQFVNDELVRRFRIEAEAAASLRHPNIVAVHEFGEHQGQHYMSMEFVAGRSLGQAVREHPLPARRAAQLLQTISEAIDYAHRQGILHRDLKPSNVLLDQNGVPHVSDFGLAKRMGLESSQSPGPTFAGQVLGSPNYMSPEQANARHAEVGPASDVYSLGAILYHLLTGRPPFLADTMEAVLLQVLNSEPVAPRLLNNTVPRPLEIICLKCLEKSPHVRYASAQALAEDLARWLAGQPIRARPAPTVAKAWRWCRRRPAIAGLAAAILLLVLFLVVGSMLAAFRFHRLRDEVRQNLYVADMNVALRYFEEGNTAQALALLGQHRPSGGHPDLRGFEWRHLWRLCRGSCAQALPVHKQVTGTIQYSADGRLVGVYCWNDTVRVWNLQTSRNILTQEQVTGFGGFLGRDIVVSRRDDSLQVCSAETGATNQSVAQAGMLVGFAPGASIAATLGTNDTLTVWDLATMRSRFTVPGVVRRRLDHGWRGPATLSRDGSRLALIQPGSNPLRPDASIRLWDVASGAEMPPLSVNRQIRTLEFSPDAKSLALGDGDGNVALWNLPGREPRVFKAHQFPVLTVAFTPDGRTLATGSSDWNSIRLWDVTTGEPKSRQFSGQVGDVWALTFSPDGRNLLSGTRDGPIRIWNLDDSEVGESVPERLHADEYGNFLFSPDSQYIAGGCADGTVKVWSVATLQVRAVLRNASYVVAFSADGQSLLVSTKTGVPEWRSLDAATTRRVPPFDGNIHRVVSVDVSPDGRVAALGLPDGRIQLQDIEAGKSIGPTLAGHAGAVRSVAFSPAQAKLVSGGNDKAVMVWDLKTGTRLWMNSEHRGSVCAVAVSPNGRMLASGCGAETIKLWNLETMSTGSLASISYHKSAIRTLAFSPDGQRLASGSEDRTVKLWHVGLHRELASFRHEARIRQVLFSPDGNTLATVTDSGTLRVYRTASLKDADEEFAAR